MKRALVSKKLPKSLKSGNCEEKCKLKKLYNNALTFVFLTVVGINLIFQNFTFTDVIGSQNNVKQDKRFKTIANVENKTARLARVINAIAIQNEIHERQSTMKQVLMEILDVQDKFLVGTTNKTGVLEAINAVKALDSLTTEIKETITATTKILKELEVHDNILPKPRITDILFSSDIYKFNFSEIATIASSMDAYSKLVLKELEVPNTNIETLVDDFVELVKCSFRMSVTMSRLDIPNGFKIFAESLQSLDSFGTDIEKYLRLTDPAYIKGLTETLNSLMQSSTKTEIFLNSAGITRFKRQLDVIDKVFSTTVRASDKKTLIGFPQGSKDFEALLNDLDDDWLKKVLNRGKSIEELKQLLIPIYNLKTEMATVENVWKSPARKMCSNLIRQSIKSLEKIEELKPKRILSSLKKMNDTLIRLKPLANLNISNLIDVKTLIRNSDMITNFSIEVNDFVNLTELMRRFYSAINPHGVVMFRQEPMDDKYTFIKSHISDANFDNFRLIISKAKFLDNKQRRITHLLSKFDGLRDTLTEDSFTKLRNIIKIPKMVKSEIKELKNHINFLSSLSLEKKIEIDQISLLLFSALDYDHLRKNRKTKIEQTEQFYRLKNFPYARETTFQLSYSYRTLTFYRRNNLRQIVQEFLRTVSALANKIESLPLGERRLCSACDNKLLLNISSTEFLSEIDALPFLFRMEEQSLKSLGNALSVLDHVNSSFSNVSLMMSTLDELKLTSIGQSEEILNVEKTITQLEELYFATLRKKGLLPKLLEQTDLFFQSFFTKNLKPDTFWTTLLIFGATVAILVISGLFAVFMWFRKRTTKQDIKQVEKKSIS